MAMGGDLIRVRTGVDGKAYVDLSHMDKLGAKNKHHCYQFVARFNADHRDPDYKPYQTCQFQLYSNLVMDPLL